MQTRRDERHRSRIEGPREQIAAGIEEADRGEYAPTTTAREILGRIRADRGPEADAPTTGRREGRPRG